MDVGRTLAAAVAWLPHRQSRAEVRRFIAAAAIVACLLGNRSSADSPCTVVCNGPGCIDFWVIDTRSAPPCGDYQSNMGRIAYFHCEPTGWVRYSLEGFVAATDTEVPVTFYVHGLFSKADSSLKQARDLFGTVGAGLPAFRGVLWSWPSDFECGMSIPDQAERGVAHTPVEAFYLASVIDRLGPRVAVSLVGHSLGTRIVVAALHGLATRTIRGQALPPVQFPQPRPIQAALIAAAIEPHALWPGGEYEGVISQIDHLLISHNCEDRVLRADERVFKHLALGRRGLPIPAAKSQEFLEKVSQVDANPAVGKRHVPTVYFESPMVAGWLRPYVGYLQAPDFGPQPPPDPLFE
ncbi:MAG TPA: hypothetical protein VFI31_26040 [Pirellulales bacterium]|nr:hypothetical protein [Pirellulales bacterium]